MEKMPDAIDRFRLKRLGHTNARLAAQAYREAGREDLAADAEALVLAFE